MLQEVDTGLCVRAEMCVHLLGAGSSPSVAGYALRKTAHDGAKLYGDAAAEAVIRNFYVDDFCKSEKSTQLTVSLIRNVDSMCDSGGFNLTKLISNSREVLESIPVEKRAQALRMCNITDVTLPIERALGVIWNVENDALGFRIQFSSKPLTRKVILSDVTSIYDPDGRGSAFVLPGKKILQEITADKEDWDAPLSEQHTKRWNVWKEDILALENVEVPRCYIPHNFGEPTSQSLHCFSNASLVGYGQVSYLRSVNTKGEVHVAQVMAKSHVAPLDSKTIPRLELTAGTVSVKVAALLLEELGCPDLVVFYWTDSTIVLGYICNKTKRFRTYVANRVSLIHDYSSELQWRHVISEDNPADFTSRGLSPNSVEKVKKYFDGPTFLWEEEDKWPIRVAAAVEEDDTELKPEKFVVNKVVVSEEFDLLTRLETRFSSWYRLVRRMALVIKFVGAVKARVSKEHTTKSRRLRGGAHKAVKCALSTSDISDAENLVIKLTQRKYMQKEFILLGKREPKASRDQEKESKKINKRSSLSKLSPCINNNGLICVGGRLKNSSLESQRKHPIVIPKKSPASILLTRRAHEKVAHGGRGATLNQLRTDGLWVVGAHSAVRHCIDKCRTCTELRGKLSKQRMADLPLERVEPSPPFTHCGADCFGPYTIKEGRKELKRYGCLFTCMSCRAVHIEVMSQMNADSLILALRRFIDRRGQVSSIRTDNGTNFVGAENELKRCLEEMDQDKIREYLLAKGCDWIAWEKNPPTASHMGGVWERQIRSIRTILTALMKEHPGILDGESLSTLMTETEAIINSRPLTVESLTDPSSPIPLSPIQLLTYKSDVVFPPPGEFERCDLYCRKQWRRVQFLANQFWHRWKVEYLASLQVRQKWTATTRNFCVGDIVLVKDEEIFTNRNGWPMARVEEVYPSDDGMVRKVGLRVAKKQTDKTRSLIRPISKLILLVETDDLTQ